jgi:hypothetical protein
MSHPSRYNGAQNIKHMNNEITRRPGETVNRTVAPPTVMNSSNTSTSDTPCTTTATSPLPDKTPLAQPEFFAHVEPWPEPVDGPILLDALVQLLQLFVVLPKWAPETLALWVLHTYAFELRDVTTYLGIESPEKRCGKTTLLNILGELVHRAIASSNISSPAFYRVIQEKRPTLLIDEADTFLQGNDELRGILNSGYSRRSAWVLRVIQNPSGQEKSKTDTSGLGKFSCWCPKAMAAIGRLPDTLADRCILIRMQRKTQAEKCERFRSLQALEFKRKCARFVQDHALAIAAAAPELPPELNDRAADIWEPLFALADLAGGHWPNLARQAALNLSSSGHEPSPFTALLIDITLAFLEHGAERLFSGDLVEKLNAKTDRPWTILSRNKPVTEMWLAMQLGKYDIRPRPLRMDGSQKRGYELDDLWNTLKRYVPGAYVILKAAADEAAGRRAAKANHPLPSAVDAPPEPQAPGRQIAPQASTGADATRLPPEPSTLHPTISPQPPELRPPCSQLNSDAAGSSN